MTILEQLSNDKSIFHSAIATKPSGKYAHFVLLRETESFPLFQTDGSLNVVRVRGGLVEANADAIMRLIMFKRKQSSPERLTGRELLRSVGIISEIGERSCTYNSAGFCKKCPDCILYGYAIGSEGAEKSKVYVDTAYSITPYDLSHKPFSWNGLFEHGTMTAQDTGKTRSSFGEQDYVVPQVFFPSVVTLRDPTYEGFLYVFGNLLRTARYGAQETRTGMLFNHLVGVVFSNGEIFSNLRFTQGIFDVVQVLTKSSTSPQAESRANDEKSTTPSTGNNDLIKREMAYAAAVQTYLTLIEDEPVTHDVELFGPEATALVKEVTNIYSSKQKTAELLTKLDEATRAYATNARKPSK